VRRSCEREGGRTGKSSLVRVGYGSLTSFNDFLFPGLVFVGFFLVLLLVIFALWVQKTGDEERERN